MECDRHNCHFRSFFALLSQYWPQKSKFGKNVKKPGYIIILCMCTINQDHNMYGSWDMKCNRHNFLSSCTIFCPFTPLTAWKMKISKMKKKPGDIILHKCTKNPDHRLYCSWDKKCDGCNCYFHFGLYFSLLLPPAPNSPKNENFKTTKKNIWRSSKSPQILSFYTIVPKIMITCYIYCSRDMASVRCNCYFSFWAIFCPFTPQRNQNFKKLKTNPGDIIILQKCTKNHDLMLYCSWDMACDKCIFLSFWAISCPFTLLTIQKIKISKK